MRYISPPTGKGVKNAASRIRRSGSQAAENSALTRLVMTDNW